MVPIHFYAWCKHYLVLYGQQMSERKVIVITIEVSFLACTLHTLCAIVNNSINKMLANGYIMRFPLVFIEPAFELEATT